MMARNFADGCLIYSFIYMISDAAAGGRYFAPHDTPHDTATARLPRNAAISRFAYSAWCN